MSDQRWCFRSDEDGHGYLIPSERRDEFDRLLYEVGESDGYVSFTDAFDKYRAGGSFQQYTFTNPLPKPYMDKPK